MWGVTARAKPSWLPPSGLVKKERKPTERACTRKRSSCVRMAPRVHGVCMACAWRCNVAFCLQREPLRGGVVIDLDAEGDRWREEADGWRGRRERRGQRGDGQQAASQLAPTECEVSDRHLGVVTGGCMSGHLAASNKQDLLT